MKVTGKSETSGAGGKASSKSGEEKPRTRFSEVLEEKKKRTTDDGEELTKGDRRELVQLEDFSAAVSAFALPQPFSPPRDIASIDADPVAATQAPEALVTSLVREIVVEAPPDGPPSVDIQFDSRTLEGLQVRVQKAGDSVEVRFSTESEAVSRLLTANVDQLAHSLVQQGFTAPVVSVQRPVSADASSGGESRGSNRDGGSRGRRGQGRGGQQRR